eukprot:UN24772
MSTQVFAHYAKVKNAREFFEQIYLGGDKNLIKNKLLLPEARKYVGMVESLAYKVLNKIPHDIQRLISKGLKHYYQRTMGPSDPNFKKEGGGFFEITEFDEWIQCQSMMGIQHGNTLGLTRLIFTKYNCTDGKFDSDTFNDNTKLLGVIIATVEGLEHQQQINQVKPIEHTIFKDLMEEYQADTAKLQTSFWNALDQDDKNMYGWIQSVWGPNMIDKTQLTITTYV